MTHRTYTTPREVIRAEYGESRNLMTPNIVTYGAPDDLSWAAEIATGEGILPGTSICGVSVVLVNEDGSTRRSTELSRCFSGENINEVIDLGLDYMRGLDEAVRSGRAMLGQGVRA